MTTMLDDEVTAQTGGQPPSPAPAVRRFASGVVDAVVLTIGISLVVGTGLAIATDEETEWALGAWTLVFAPLYFALYHAYDEGGTPGQLELRLGMRDTHTDRPPGPRRTLARAYLGLVFCVLVVPALVDVLTLVSTGRSLRDRITRTTVVRIPLAGNVPELDDPTVAELRGVFEPPDAGTRRYLARGWTLLWARPRLLLGSVAAVYAVLLALVGVLALLIVADAPGAVEDTVYFIALATALLASGAYWTQAVMVLAVEEARVAGETSIGRTLVRGTRRVNGLSAALVLLLALGIVALVLFLPLLLAGRVALVPPALALEDRRVLGAFRRSWQLTAGRTWRSLGLVLGSLLLLGAVPLVVVVTTSFAGGWGMVAVAAVAAIPQLVVLAWLGAAWSLLYEDARQRLPPREELQYSR